MCDPGPQSKSDNAMTAKYRLLQSQYRAEVLKEDFGHGPHKNSKTGYGNMLINGEETGSNCISKAAFDFARKKVEQKKTNKALTIDEFRLFNNMLSSMPMCFNLFSDLRKLLEDDPAEASGIATPAPGAKAHGAKASGAQALEPLELDPLEHCFGSLSPVVRSRRPQVVWLVLPCWVVGAAVGCRVVVAIVCWLLCWC